MKKTRSFLLTAGIVLAMAFTLSCSDDKGNDGNSPPSGGDGYTGSYVDVTISGKVYKTVVIGTQTWMAENLNNDPGTGNSACYEDYPSNCTTYGRMYDWEAAMAACPSGWHLPSDAEWTILIDHVGGLDVAGTKLKLNSGWADRGNGTNDYGFSALPGGERDEENGSRMNMARGYWWSASENGDIYAWCFSIRSNQEKVNRYDNYKSILYSVRCVKD